MTMPELLMGQNDINWAHACNRQFYWPKKPVCSRQIITLYQIIGITINSLGGNHTNKYEIEQFIAFPNGKTYIKVAYLKEWGSINNQCVCWITNQNHLNSCTVYDIYR